MFHRHIEPLVHEALADTPVVVVHGARQTGKSTLVRTLAQETGRSYLTLDDGAVLAAATADPHGFVQGLQGPVVLDEVQRVPALLLAIKAAVDRQREPGRFVLTGSAKVLQLPDMADSLAGRMEILTLWPLSAQEQAGQGALNIADALWDARWSSLQIAPVDRADLIKRLTQGGYPEAITRASDARRSAWFDSYIQAILQRDVRELAQLEQLTEMPRLLSLLAQRSASLLNFAELSRSVGLPQTTLKRYFALLEMVFLVLRLPPWERNPGKRLVKTPKVFVMDPGLLAHLYGYSAQTLAKSHGLPGPLVESFVVAELHKHLAFSRAGQSLWHYRTQTHTEVDCLLEDRAGQLVGIEVKASATVDARDFKGLRHLQDTEGARFRHGMVLYAGRELVPFAPNLWAVPLSVFWATPA